MTELVPVSQNDLPSYQLCSWTKSSHFVRSFLSAFCWKEKAYHKHPRSTLGDLQSEVFIPFKASEFWNGGLWWAQGGAQTGSTWAVSDLEAAVSVSFFHSEYAGFSVTWIRKSLLYHVARLCSINFSRYQKFSNFTLIRLLPGATTVLKNNLHTYTAIWQLKILLFHTNCVNVPCLQLVLSLHSE